jgi:hypothetical protein
MKVGKGENRLRVCVRRPERRKLSIHIFSFSLSFSPFFFHLFFSWQHLELIEFFVSFIFVSMTQVFSPSPSRKFLSLGPLQFPQIIGFPTDMCQQVRVETKNRGETVIFMIPLCSWRPFPIISQTSSFVGLASNDRVPVKREQNVHANKFHLNYSYRRRSIIDSHDLISARNTSLKELRDGIFADFPLTDYFGKKNKNKWGRSGFCCQRWLNVLACRKMLGDCLIILLEPATFFPSPHLLSFCGTCENGLKFHRRMITINQTFDIITTDRLTV